MAHSVWTGGSRHTGRAALPHKNIQEVLNKEFERCCTFLAEMMEKYGALVLRDIAVEIQYEPETWCDDAEGKRLRYEAYARRFLKRFEKAA